MSGLGIPDISRLPRHGTDTAFFSNYSVAMKRALRNTETAMFVKSDGGETESILVARFFVTYDEAVAFCRANKLAAVELVTRTDDQSEYVTPVPPKYLVDEEEDNNVIVSEVPAGQPTVEAENAPEFQRSIIPDLESNARAVPELAAAEPDNRFVEQMPEPDLATNGGSRLEAGFEECELQPPAQAEPVVGAVDESEIAICNYADFETAAHAQQFHISPPAKCDVCSADLSDRWFFVDGRVNESGEWRDMCSQCFFTKGVKIGRGKGKLYQRQLDGRWLLVGGFGH